METMWILLITVLKVFKVSGIPRLTGLEYKSGSIRGATRLYLYGSEFAADQFNSPLVGNEGLGNRVWLRSRMSAVECDVIPYYTTRNQIVCDTRAAPEGSYDVDVEVDGIDIEESSGTECSSCYFTYTQLNTPTIVSVTPSSGPPGTLVTIRGKIFTAFHDQAQLESEDELEDSFTEREILRVFWGHYLCDPVDENGELYGIALDRPTSSSGTITCKPRGTFIGSQLMSFIISKDTGRSWSLPSSVHVSGKNKLYHFQSHAVIYSVEPSEGSTAGGLLVTVTGNYFDEDTVVLIGGQPCEISNVSITAIQCVTSPGDSSSSGYPGNRGINKEVWLDSYVDNLNEAIFNDSAADFRYLHISEAALADTGLGEPPNFIGRLRGFYVPPRDGYYSFSFICDDHAYLYLSNSTREEDKRQIAYCTRYGVNYFAYPEGTSEKILLEGGHHYFLEATLWDRGGIGYVKVGVHMYDVPFLESEFESVITEQQRISLQSVEQNEIQVLSRVADVQELQVIVVEYEECQASLTSNCSPVPRFTLEFMGEVTGEITADTNPMEIQNALNDLATIEPIGVEVFTSEDDSRTYYVLFLTSTENLPEITVNITEGVANVRVEEEQYAIPPFDDDFSIVIDGVASAPVSFSSTADEVQEALIDMITINCQRTTNARAYYFQDFERMTVGFETGKRTTQAEPFCGTSSLKNPQIIFKAGATVMNRNAVNEIDALYVNQLCFAFRGAISRKLYLGVAWVNRQNKQRYNTLTVNYETYPTTNWEYMCFNLEEKIRSSWIAQYYKSTAELKVRVIKVDGNSDVGYYIDNLYIGSSQDNYIRTSRIPKPNDVYIMNVEVEKEDDDTFRFTFVAAECGYGIPLIGIEGALSVIGSDGDDAVEYRNGSWPTNVTLTVIREQPAAPPIGGTFDLTQDGVTIPGVTVQTSASRMKSLLQSHFDVGSINVEQAGSCSSSQWDIYWLSKGGSQPLIEVNGTHVTGYLVTASTERVVEGRIFVGPIPGEFLRTFHCKPQVEVMVNGVPSRCDGNCSFEYTSDATPTVTSVSPDSGNGCNGTSITLSGTGLSSVTGDNQVTIGGEECVVTNSSSTSIVCTVGATEAGYYNVSVLVEGNGYAEYPNGTMVFTHDLEIASFSPTEGSRAGGSAITINGCGFSRHPDQNSVIVGGKECKVKSAEYNKLVCIISIDTDNSHRKKRDSSVSVIVSVNDMSFESTQLFSFVVDLTPTITGMNPANSSVLGGGNLTLSGSGFGTSDGNVTINGKDCEILSQADSEILCIIPDNGPGAFPVELRVGAKGFADVSAIDKFQYILQVDSIFPVHGSLFGGTLLMVKGAGFGSNAKDISVGFGGYLCDVKFVTEEEILCTTPDRGSVYKVKNSGKHETYGFGYKWNPAVVKIKAGDSIRWEWAIPTHVIGIKYTVQQTADPESAEYNGIGFYAGPATTSGSYSYTFTAPGTYYYSSGPVDSADTLYMKGVIYVEPAVSETYKLDVVLGEHSALHNAGGDSTDPVDDACSLQTQIKGCTDVTSRPEESGPSNIYFSYYECSTPTVHNIDPIFGTSEDEITVTGEGFGPLACQNDLQFGGHSCNIVSVNETTITCTLDVSDEPSVGYWLEASLNVGNRGYAAILKNNPSERAYTLIPYVGSVSHQSGSTAGGLPITLVGTGFSALTQGAVSVFIGFASCEVSTFNYTMITCVTGRSSEITSFLVVTVNTVLADVCESCYFSYDLEYTALMESVFPQVINGSSSNLTILGDGFPSSSDDVTVTVNGVECSSVYVSSDKSLLSCDIGFVPVGTYDVIVNIADHGNAELNGDDTQVESSAVLYTVTPDLGSKRGGQKITIYGNGFHDGDTVVEIGGKECLIQSINISHIECITPVLSVDTYDVEVTSSGTSYVPVSYETSFSVTPVIKSVTPSSGETGDSITIVGKRFTNVTSDVEVMIDDVPCVVTSAEEDTIECTVGKHSAGTYKIQIFKDGIGYAENENVTFTYSLGAFTDAVECGFGGGITLTLNGSGFDEDDTKVFICGKECPIYNISASEITCDVPGAAVSGESKVCDVVVSAPSVNMNVITTNNITYHANLTSNITSVDPRRGGTGGGTLLSIMGSGFLSSGNKVTIAGTVCEVQTESTLEIVCKTGAHSPTEMAKVRVDVGAAGIALQDNADFFYIDVWSSIYTWGGSNPPVEGDFVIIPEGQTILLDESTPVLRILLLKGGHMVFDEKDIELHAEYIIITNGGSLTVGTEDEPFQHEATIMLHGHVRTQELPIFGAKVLAVRNGTLDLHGKPVAVTWTYLASAVSRGKTELTLVQPVDWNVGDNIVIASTGNYLAQRESELLTITGISTDKMTLEFTPPLKYPHISLKQTIDGTVVETRAEVGLLSHNVKFRGSVHEDWVEKIEGCSDLFDTNQFATQSCFLGRFGEETGSDQYGAHIMLFAKEMDKGWIKGRISYVEVTHAGQAFRLGRYPIHFHMSGDITGSYVRGCGIYNTFNRAVTVHGVHGFLVEHNVAYNVMGHAFFLEDGIETGNVLQYNLAVFVRPSSSLLNVDVTPAAYWITNPNNTVRHNAAAGGSHLGFWYNAPENPGGPSFTLRVQPRHVPLGEFYNNSAHTQGWYGIWIFPIYFPSKPAKFNKFFAWEVSKGAEAVEVGMVQFHNFLITDAHITGMEFLSTFSVWGETGSYVNNSVIIGYSDVNKNNASGECTSVGVHLPKTTGLTVDGVKFVNFDRPQCVCIKACRHCTENQGGFESRFKNIEWVNAPRKAVFKWEHECWLEDLDGTLTGGVNYTLLPQNDNLPPDHCEFGVAHSSSLGVLAAVCDETVRFHRMAWNQPSPTSLHYKNVILTNRFGESVIPYHKKRLTHADGWMATLVEKENYNMRFEDVEHITNISYAARFDSFVDGQYVYITHDFMHRPDAFSLIGRVWNGTKGIPHPSNSTHGDFTFNNNTKQLTYIVTGNGNQRVGNYFIDLDVYRCHYKNCIPPKPKPQKTDTVAAFRRWSDAASWKDAPANWGGNKGNGKFGLPQDGDDVQILPGIIMVADVALPAMHKLFIYGTLEFEDTRNFVVNATYIFIHGGRLVAGFSEEEPFTHKLHFILQGNHMTPDIPLPNGPNMGSKVLGVFGGLDLHGVTRDVTWTQLAATVLVDDDTIQVADETDWGVGDEIVVTTTSYETWQTETFVITEKINKFTFRLNSSFEYTHIANTHKLSDNSSEYVLSAEVGVLTRNIIIEGASYRNLFKESFGARVIVGTFVQDEEEFRGHARISNVQFKHTGQEGWTDYYDPRYSLAFLNVEVTEEAPSYVRGCSFHNGFSTAIGVYGTHGLEVSDNVIHHVVGPGIVSRAEDTKLIHNLVSLIIFPGEYQDRYEPENLLWNGGIEVVNARRVILINNTVAGSERVGFKVSGVTCDESSGEDATWYGNVVHATLHGVHLYVATSSRCTMVSGFYIWNSFDYGIYAQMQSSLVVANSWLVDNKAGLLALIVGPRATTHKVVDKFVEIRDTTFVGTSPSFDCSLDSPEASGFTSDHRSPKPPGAGIVGVYFPVFMSEINGGPFKPFHSVRSYPALRGVSKLKGVTFAEYGDACSRQNVAIMTNPASGDASHPVHVESVRYLNVLKDHYLFIHRPSLSMVNPADCVDMDCDGMKKAMIRDLDGSMLGEVGTVIPQSEFEWDGDPRRGLGDYRIPRTMLTEPDGSRIPADDIAPNKGIYRGSGDCMWISAWQAYKCHNLDHMMMVVESMDADTETRRVSPVSLYSDSYIDLINGPQDHGWCRGYTCQERISTFYTIVDTSHYYDLHFTGTSPQKLRYHLLNADDTQSVVISTYYSNPQRLDVYANGIYILPTNGDMENGVFTWKSPDAGETNADYYPSLSSKVLGENYFDRDLDQLFILIRGSTMIEVLTTPVVMTTFGVPAVEVDNFFEENIIENLANLLNIPKSKIRIVEIISEDSVRRRRRATGEVEVIVEIGNPPSATSSSTNDLGVSSSTMATPTNSPDVELNEEDPLSFDALLEIQTIIANEMQTGGLEDAIGYHVTHLSMTDPVDTPVDPTGGVRATNETVGSANDTGLRYDEQQALREEEEDSGHTSVEYSIPTQLIVVTEPGGAMKDYPFLTQPKINVVDGQGNIVEQLGHSSNPWLLEVSLRESSGLEGASLFGIFTYSFTNGWVNFTNLAINTTGSGFILDFAVIYPTTVSLTTSSAEFDVEVQQNSLEATTIGYEMQTGGSEDAIGSYVTHLMTDPGETMGYDEQQDFRKEEEDSGHTSVEYSIPSQLIVVTEPGGAVKDYPFLTQPKIKVVDGQGNLVEQLGNASHPWLLRTSLRKDNVSEGVLLYGNTTNSFNNGWVNFTNLAINTTGSGFILDFAVIYPSMISLTTSSAEFDVKAHQYSLKVVDQPSVVNEGDQFDLVVQVRAEVTGITGHISGSGTAKASLATSSYYRGDLQGNVNVDVDLSAGLITFKNLSVSSSGTKYILKISVTITLSTDCIEQSLETEAFDVVDPDAVTHTGETVTLTLRFDADYDTVVAGQEESLEIYFLNHIAPTYENVTFSNVIISKGSILITFDITGDVEDAQADMWEDILQGDMVLNFNGYTLKADTYLLVDGEQYVGEEGTSTVSSILNLFLVLLRITRFPFWAIVCIVILFLIVVIIIALIVYKVVCHKGSKVGSLSIDPHSSYACSKDVAGEQWIPNDPKTSEIDEGPSKDDNALMAPPSLANVKPPESQVPSSTPPSLPGADSEKQNPQGKFLPSSLDPSSPPPSLPEADSEKQNIQDEKIVKKFIRVKNADGTFKKLGMVEVNMTWNLSRVGQELRTSALPADVGEKQFIFLDEQLKDIASENQNSLLASEVYPGETVLIKWVEGDA